MTRLEDLGVTALDEREQVAVAGGSDFSYALGYTIGLMMVHQDVLIKNMIAFYAS